MSNSIFSYDNTLPGVITEIDSHLASDYDTSLFGTTDSVVVIGTAFDGPTGVPVPIYSVEHGAYVYGKTYDSKTRRETSLVTGIKDAWDHGCRTIYAMRINGTEMYKDFDFCAETDFKLRVKSRYPSNLGKQVYIKYDNTSNAESFTIYKPASRATIKEKMAGLVEDENSVMVNEIRVAEDYAFTRDSKLVDVLEIINDHSYNNVIELDIVDKDGNVVTSSSEAYEITLGHLFPGVYFIGREKSLCEKQTDISIKMIMDENDAVPFSNFQNKFYRVLNLNTDVSATVPIYCESVKTLRSFLEPCGITIDKADDYLENAEVSNKAFPEDGIDYEETNLTEFEKYQKLGSGYAITAVAERRVDGEGKEIIPKVKEAKLDDVQRVVATGDGVYSVLEDTKIRYHVLASDICADTVIGGKIPKHTDFKTTLANNVELMNGLISATAKIDKDNAYTPQEYSFRFYEYKDKLPITKESLYRDRIVEIIGFADSLDKITSVTDAKPGSKCLLISENPVLYIANDKGVYEETQDKKYAGTYIEENVTKYGKQLYLAGFYPFVTSYENNKLVFTAITDGKEETGTDYVMMKDDMDVFITTMDNPLEKKPFMATVEEALSEEDNLYVYFQNHGVGTNFVMISYPHFDTLTMTDFVEMLNESPLNKLFDFELTQAGRILKDEYVVDADKQAAEDKKTAGDQNAYPVLTPDRDINEVMEADRVRGYDYSLHIPYYTTDNFARHLSQHCTYTELKTYPTHGIIGCQRISDVSKTNLAKKIQELKEFNWSLYVKTDLGRNMLNENNLPYSIGRNVSATLFQAKTLTPSNYSAIVNGATAYAGLISSLDIGRSSTAQTIDIEPMYEFSRSQLQTLSDLGFVTVKNSFTKGYVITDGITMAPADDLLRRLFNTRVLHFVEEYIRAACEPFIGQANSSANRNSLQTALNSKLTSLVDSLIRSYEFKIIDDGTADQYTYIDINYTIVPMNEIREIRNYIRVQNT